MLSHISERNSTVFDKIQKLREGVFSSFFQHFRKKILLTSIILDFKFSAGVFSSSSNMLTWFPDDKSTTPLSGRNPIFIRWVACNQPDY